MGVRDLFHYVVFLMDFSFYYILVYYEGFPHLGVRDHFFYMVDQYFGNLMEVPTTRLPNVKMLLRWPSRMQILEQFDGTIEWKAIERSDGASP